MGCGVEGMSGLSGSVVFLVTRFLGAEPSGETSGLIAGRGQPRAPRRAQPRARGPISCHFDIPDRQGTQTRHPLGIRGTAGSRFVLSRARLMPYRAVSRPYATGVRPTCTPHRPGVRIWHTSRRKGRAAPLSRAAPLGRAAPLSRARGGNSGASGGQEPNVGPSRFGILVTGIRQAMRGRHRTPGRRPHASRRRPDGTGRARLMTASNPCSSIARLASMSVAKATLSSMLSALV